MLTVLTAIVLAAGAATSPVPKAGDIVVGFEIVDRGSPASAIGVQRLSRDGAPLWGDGRALGDLSVPGDLRKAPAICDDGQGGVLVVYEHEFSAGDHAGDCDIVAQRFGADGSRLWAGPKPVASIGSAERRPIVVNDGLGGAIVVYEWTGQAGDTDVLAQRIDGTGRCLWNDGAGPVALGASRSAEGGACVVADGRGGAFVFFEWAGADGNVDIMAEHVAGDGRRLWGRDQRALMVAGASHIERNPVAVPDGAGGAIVVFEVEPRSGEYQGDRDIAAQRVSPDGALLWGSGNAVAVASSRGRERDPVAVADGMGGVVAAFEMTPATGENAGDADVLAQRLDASGRLIWGDGERSVAVSSSPALEHAPAIVSDGAGGAIVACELERRTGESAGDIDVVAQRVSGAGAMLWNEGRKSVVVGTSKWREQRPRLFADGEGGVIVVYTATGVGGESDGDVDLEAARLDGSGRLLWQAGERSVDIAASKRLERNPGAVVIGAR